MNLLFISKYGDSLGLAQRVKGEGHNSYLCLVDGGRVGDGMVDKPTSNGSIYRNNGQCIQSNVNRILDEVRPDLVVFDTIGLGKVADYIKGKGVAVFGGCNWADHAELDLDYAKRLMRAADIPTTPLTGVGVRCGIWWDGLSAAMAYVVYSDDGFMNSDLGPSVGDAGYIIKGVSLRSRLVKESVGKMTRLLKKTTYRGPISIGLVVGKSGVYGMGFTVHFTHNLLELYRGPLAQLLYSVAIGVELKGDVSGDYAIAVRVSIPPYPHIQPGISGIRVGGVSEKNEGHIWWRDVKMGEGYESAGMDGHLLDVTARGRDVGECKKRVYRTLDNLSITDKQYRTDVGERVNKDMRQLKVWGYL